MRIAVVTVSVGAHVRVYVDHLRAAGHEVTVLTNGARYLDTDVPTIDLRPFGGRRFKLPRSLISRLRRNRLCEALAKGRFDVVNCQMVMLDALSAIDCSPVPVVLSFHGSDLYRRAEMPESFAERLPAAIAKAAVVHAVSQHMADELISLGAPTGRVETFQYGIDPAAFPAAGERDSNRIVSVRALKPLYRVHLLIEAMPAVLAVKPQAVLEIYDQGSELQKLRDLASSLNVDSNVRFLGRQPLEVIAEAVGSAAVWASMAQSDGTPLSLLEAMAAGAYPVLADIPTLHEWIEPGRGTFVEPTPESVAAGLIEGLERAATCDHVAGNRRIVEERADRTVNLARFERMLARAAAEAR